LFGFDTAVIAGVMTRCANFFPLAADLGTAVSLRCEAHCSEQHRGAPGDRHGSRNMRESSASSM